MADSPAKLEADGSQKPAALRWNQSSLLLLRNVLGLWLVLLVWSFVRVWIPGVNEPHYLGKALHFWNPQWCAADLFLESSNPHFVFYVTLGWLTQLFSLPMTAIIGRLVGLFVFAIGWSELTRPLLPRFSGQLSALGWFLLFQAIGNLSGEWVVGGIESKVLAYGFGFWAVGRLQSQRFVHSGCLMGLAVSFHPLVGCWLTLCLLAGWVWCSVRSRNTAQAFGPSLKMIAIAAGGWIVCSLPGMIPALMVLLEPVDKQTNFAGDYLQVYYRLKHHLDPMTFSATRLIGYGVMTVAIGLFAWWGSRGGAQKTGPLRAYRRLLFGIFLASLIIASVGYLIGLRWEEPAEMWGLRWRAKLLKFYPFRIYDLLTPVILSLFVGDAIVRGCLQHGLVRRVWRFSGPVVLGIGLLLSYGDRDSSRMSPEKKQAWLEVCRWLKRETPADSLVVGPPNAWAIHWFASRAEYVNRKNCPQDATSLVEWNRRLLLLKRWGADAYADRVYSEPETDQLAAETGIEYFIVDRLGPFAQQPVYENVHFRVYAIGDARHDD